MFAKGIFQSSHMQHAGLESTKLPQGSCWQYFCLIRERTLESVHSEFTSIYEMRSTENDNIKGKFFKTQRKAMI